MSQNAIQHSFRAKSIQRTLGTFRAARFLHKRGVSLDEALAILSRKG